MSTSENICWCQPKQTIHWPHLCPTVGSGPECLFLPMTESVTILKQGSWTFLDYFPYETQAIISQCPCVKVSASVFVLLLVIFKSNDPILVLFNILLSITSIRQWCRISSWKWHWCNLTQVLKYLYIICNFCYVTFLYNVKQQHGNCVKLALSYDYLVNIQKCFHN